MNLHNLKKVEILWLYDHRCKAHGMSYLEHPNCFERERDTLKDCIIQPEKLGFLDIEASNLNADFGYILSYAIKNHDGDILGDVLTTKDIRSYNFDKSLVKRLVRDMRKFDRLIVYWGKNYRFDIPYIRTRALHWNIDFPRYREMFVQDAYDMVKPYLKLHRNRLETVCEYFGIPAKKHRLNPEVWQRAMAGDADALDYIFEHNIEDVESLEQVWEITNGFTRKSKTSI